MEQLPAVIHKSWHQYLQPLFEDSKLKLIKEDLVAKQKIYPEKKNIFRVFSMPLEDIKVVILGQDPYPSVGQANGYAFAVNNDVEVPKSLKIIRGEVLRNIGIDLSIGADLYNEKLTAYAAQYPEWKTLEHWAAQGVFLLNTALTVKAGEAGSHVQYWQWFTKEVIRTISIHGNNPVWMMWGAKAKAFIGNVHAYYKWHNTYRGKSYNYILEADHPAAETYPNPTKKFSGCNHFTLCNDILQFKEQSPIKW